MTLSRTTPVWSEKRSAWSSAQLKTCGCWMCHITSWAAAWCLSVSSFRSRYLAAIPDCSSTTAKPAMFAASSGCCRCMAAARLIQCAAAGSRAPAAAAAAAPPLLLHAAAATCVPAAAAAGAVGQQLPGSSAAAGSCSVSSWSWWSASRHSGEGSCGCPAEAAGSSAGCTAGLGLLQDRLHYHVL